ncbi:MAG: hypothetical protein NVS2B12_37340 [Ktedonobacteraceae bacterium]
MIERWFIARRFYKHYEDKYALLSQGVRHMYDILLQAEEHAPPGAFSLDDPPPYFVHLFVHVAEHQQFYKLMLCEEDIGRFQKLIKDYIVGQVEAKLCPFVPADHASAVPVAVHLQFMAGAVTSILAWWLENNMLFKCSCERRLIAASESATAELKQADQWRRTGAVIQALSLTQLNGMPYSPQQMAQYLLVLHGTSPHHF